MVHWPPGSFTQRAGIYGRNTHKSYSVFYFSFHSSQRKRIPPSHSPPHFKGPLFRFPFLYDTIRLSLSCVAFQSAKSPLARLSSSECVIIHYTKRTNLPAYTQTLYSCGSVKFHCINTPCLLADRPGEFMLGSGEVRWGWRDYQVLLHCRHWYHLLTCCYMALRELTGLNSSEQKPFPRLVQGLRGKQQQILPTAR